MKTTSTVNNALLYLTQRLWISINFVSYQDYTSDINNSINKNIDSKILDTMVEQISSEPAASIYRIQTGDTGTPFDEAIKIHPNNIQLLTNAGIYLADKKEMYLQALSLFDKVLKKDTKYVQAIYNKAETLEILGRDDEAEKLFDTAKELDPTYRGDFILSPPKVFTSSSPASSILAKTD
jgi:tetratricopeptide (TPR) repeat protein